jgi:hypothetical protein
MYGILRFRINSSTIRVDGRLSRRRSSSLSMSSDSGGASETADLLAAFICDERVRAACTKCARPSAVKRVLLRVRCDTYRNDYLIATGSNRLISLWNHPERSNCEVLDTEDEFTEVATLDFDFVRTEYDAQCFGAVCSFRKMGRDEMIVWQDVEFAGIEFDA